jgi:hypothetical protein
MKERKENKRPKTFGTKTLGTISNMGMAASNQKPNAVKYKVPLTTKSFRKD